MNLPFVEKYKGYTLKCMPQPTHDEGYLAFVIITHGTEPVHVDRAAVLDLPGFELKSDAALAALSAAIRWVDDVVPLQPAHSYPAEIAMETPSARKDPAEAVEWQESEPNGAYLRASRRTGDRRGQFSDRRQVRLIDQPRPIDQLPAVGEPRRA
jgi:hypothetical protein